MGSRVLVVSGYDDQLRELKLMIAEASTLRDAQSPSGRHYLRFQDRIDALTDRLEGWESALPELEKLDREILSARAELAQVKAESDEGPWSTFSIVAGVVGGFALLAGLTLDVSWFVWAFAGVAAVIVVGSVFLSLAVRRDNWDEQQRCGDALDVLLAERKRLLPSD